MPLKDSGYAINHSANVLLFDRRGRFDPQISYREDFDRAMGKIRQLFAGSSQLQRILVCKRSLGQRAEPSARINRSAP
ncbi:MAG: hypothetical protein ACKVKF_22380 [Rhodobacterales bacterium]